MANFCGFTFGEIKIFYLAQGLTVIMKVVSSERVLIITL